LKTTHKGLFIDNITLLVLNKLLQSEKKLESNSDSKTLSIRRKKNLNPTWTQTYPKNKLPNLTLINLHDVFTS